jgi:hypothetical protein
MAARHRRHMDPPMRRGLIESDRYRPSRGALRATCLPKERLQRWDGLGWLGCSLAEQGKGKRRSGASSLLRLL